MSANRIDASSYLSAITLRDGSLSRSAIVVGKMLASNRSERSYSASIAASARSISRSVYQIVATTITAEPTTELTKPTVSVHGGPNPRLSGTVSSSAMVSAPPAAATSEASAMRSIPRTSTISDAATRK